MARNHSNVSCEVTLARRLYTEETPHGPKWYQLESYGPKQQQWIDIARGILRLSPVMSEKTTRWMTGGAA